MQMVSFVEKLAAGLQINAPQLTRQWRPDEARIAQTGEGVVGTRQLRQLDRPSTRGGDGGRLRCQFIPVFPVPALDGKSSLFLVVGYFSGKNTWRANQFRIWGVGVQ
jgi:hypothetical protein